MMSDLSKEIVLQKLKETGCNEFDVLYMDSVDSTNVYAMKYGDTLKSDVNNLIVADCQTAGKGRLGRSFESQKGKGIFASMVLRPLKKAYEIANITLVAALAVVRALDKLWDFRTQIKWPNDIIISERKLCGILTEMKSDGDRVRFVVVGIGINVNNEVFSKEISDKATSMYMEAEKRYDRSYILANIVAEFKKLYTEYLHCGDLSFMKDEYNERLINRNQPVMVEYRGEKCEAVQLGIDESGALKVLIDNEEKSITTGEILVRGVRGYV